MCVICQTLCHINDFKKVPKAKYVTYTLVICPEHTEVNLTLKEQDIALKKQTRNFISQIKMQ